MTQQEFKKIIKFPIFESRWMLILFYYGLILAQVIYAIKFLQNLGNLIVHFWQDDYSQVMLMVLELVDIAMIANLIKMVISGSYQSFIERLPEDHTEQVSSGILKVKMATSLVLVSGINLLQPFVDAAHATVYEICVKCGIHMIFVFSAIGLGVIEYLHALCEKLERSEPKEEKAEKREEKREAKEEGSQLWPSKA